MNEKKEMTLEHFVNLLVKGDKIEFDEHNMMTRFMMELSDLRKTAEEYHQIMKRNYLSGLMRAKEYKKKLQKEDEMRKTYNEMWKMSNDYLKEKCSDKLEETDNLNYYYHSSKMVLLRTEQYFSVQ
jgi:hypothetical protein